jgi:hypothetical protein
MPPSQSRVSELGLGAAVLAYQEALEDGLIESATDLSRRVEVCLETVGEEGEAAVEVRLDGLHVGLGGSKQPLRRLQLLSDPVLLAPKQVERDSSCVVSLEELVALLLEVGNAVGGDRLVALSLGAESSELLAN